MGKIALECFKIYVDVAISCVRNKGKACPTKGEVELILEHALELQQSADAAMKDVDPTGDVCIYPITLWEILLQPIMNIPIMIL